MNNKVSFEGIGEVAATFHSDVKVTAGMPVKLDAAGKALPCADNDRFAGVTLTAAKEGFAAVIIGGCMTAPASGEGVTCGYLNLVADGKGGVKKAAGTEGSECLVVAVENGVATFMM